jgi:hypothetical protein
MWRVIRCWGWIKKGEKASFKVEESGKLVVSAVRIGHGVGSG